MTDVYHIYSQPDCIFCTKAKELLDHLGLSYEDHDIATDQNARMYFKLKKFTTVPQIYVGARHIGGYTQLEGHLTGKIASYDL